MRNINTDTLFVFLLFLALTGGSRTDREEQEEQEDLQEEVVADLGDDEGGRERRGLYGGIVMGDVCPEQCLCLSEIQVRPDHQSFFTDHRPRQVLCNTGSLSVFPSKLPNVTQDISITNQNITIVPKYVSIEIPKLEDCSSSVLL